jgi:hypothetical protein
MIGYLEGEVQPLLELLGVLAHRSNVVLHSSFLLLVLLGGREQRVEIEQELGTEDISQDIVHQTTPEESVNHGVNTQLDVLVTCFGLVCVLDSFDLRCGNEQVPR